jgi:hypothetical protein
LEQGQVEVSSYLVADTQAFELVEPGEGALNDPSDPAETGTVDGALAGDLRCDAACSEKSAVLVVVVAAVGEELPWPVTRPSTAAANAGYRIEQRQ